MKKHKVPCAYANSVWRYNAVFIALFCIALLIFPKYSIRHPWRHPFVILWGVVILRPYLSLMLFRIFQAHFVRGSSFIQNNDYLAAIEEFQKNLSYLDRHGIVDRLRTIILLDHAAFSLRENTLCNIGWCYGQLGNKTEATKYYKIVLRENPNNYFALTAMEPYNAM